MALVYAVDGRRGIPGKLARMLRIALANETTIFQAQAVLEEIGRMLGGWLKSVQS